MKKRPLNKQKLKGKTFFGKSAKVRHEVEK